MGVRAGVLRIIQLSYLLFLPESHASASQAFRTWAWDVAYGR